jgi:cobalamin biosynthesis Co2+ chelatase CbiK
MANDDYIHIITGDNYEKVVQSDGVKTTVCANRFEIIASPTSDVQEQQAVQAVRDWIKSRREKVVPVSGVVSG